MHGFVVLAVSFHLVWSQGVKKDFPWYHTGSEIKEQITQLSRNCPGVEFEITTTAISASGPNSDQTVDLDVVRVNQGSSEGKKKAFIVFGEHARELISPESGLVFLRDLCGQGDKDTGGLTQRALSGTSFVIVPNANPLGRKRVEAGEYCKRTNEDGVDLNRNFGDQHHTSEHKDDEANPGPRGFSEPESQAIKDLVLQEKPDIYLSVHSGAYLLGTPYGYTANQTADNEQQMLSVLKPISEKFCNGGCPFGDLAGMIGYESKGCDIDYVKEALDTPFVFTWEIYTGNDVRGMYEEEAHARAEHREMSADAAAFFDAKSMTLLQTRSSHKQLLRGSKALQPESDENTGDCFNQFNPETQAETEAVARNWAQAFLTLCDEVAHPSGVAESVPDASPSASPSTTAAAAGETTSAAADVAQEPTQQALTPEENIPPASPPPLSAAAVFSVSSSSASSPLDVVEHSPAETPGESALDSWLTEYQPGSGK